MHGCTLTHVCAHVRAHTYMHMRAHTHTHKHTHRDSQQGSSMEAKIKGQIVVRNRILISRYVSQDAYYPQRGKSSVYRRKPAEPSELPPPGVGQISWGYMTLCIRHWDTHRTSVVCLPKMHNLNLSTSTQQTNPHWGTQSKVPGQDSWKVLRS